MLTIYKNQIQSILTKLYPFWLFTTKEMQTDSIKWTFQNGWDTNEKSSRAAEETGEKNEREMISSKEK